MPDTTETAREKGYGSVPSPIVYVESNRMSQRKRTVIDILRESPGFVSGEAISDTSASRATPSTSTSSRLRNRGYRILGVSRRGYKLEEEPCRLVMPLVAELTGEQPCSVSRFRYYDEIESTNAEAKTLAADGAPEGTVVIAECQTAGKGRLGRRWTSPAGKGLLFSVILRPTLPMNQAHLLTLVAATAASRRYREPDDASRADQVAQRPLRSRQEGRRHSSRGVRRARRSRMDRRRHRHQREHRVRRTARRPAPHGRSH